MHIYGQNGNDTTCFDNAAQAHFDAFAHVAVGAACAGRAYFSSNGEAKTARETINGLLCAAGAPTVDKTIPFGVAYTVGAVSEAAWSLLRLRGETPMTRFLAEPLSTTHWYAMTPATPEFGYLPHVSFAQGVARLAPGWASDVRGKG